MNCFHAASHQFNPLKPKSDQHLISHFSNTTESFFNIMRIEKMIANLGSFKRTLLVSINVISYPDPTV